MIEVNGTDAYSRTFAVIDGVLHQTDGAWIDVALEMPAEVIGVVTEPSWMIAGRRVQQQPRRFDGTRRDDNGCRVRALMDTICSDIFDAAGGMCIGHQDPHHKRLGNERAIPRCECPWNHCIVCPVFGINVTGKPYTETTFGTSRTILVQGSVDEQWWSERMPAERGCCICHDAATDGQRNCRHGVRMGAWPAFCAPRRITGYPYFVFDAFVIWGQIGIRNRPIG